MLLTMLSNININYIDENSKEIIADILIETKISNLDNLCYYLQDLGYSSDEVKNLLQIFEENPDVQELLTQEEKEWAISVLINGSVEDIPHENHYLKEKIIQDIFSYYHKEYYSMLLDEFSEFCDSSQINYLLQQIFTFYLDYCFFYRADREGLLDIISEKSKNRNKAEAAVNLVDLDNYSDSWKHQNATISTSVSPQNRLLTNKADIINISSSKISQLDFDYILQLVDNGAILVIQNDDDIQTCSEIVSLLNINSQDVMVDAEDKGTIELGYSIRRDGTGYIVEPVFATVLKLESDETFNLNQELENLKNSSEAYIDPIDFYYSKKDNIKSTENNQGQSPSGNGALQIDRRSAYVSCSGIGYLYGKNGDAVWGQKTGYEKFGYVEMSAYIIRKYSKNGYDYDAVECSFTATAENGKHVEWYSVFNHVISNSYMETFLYVNEQNEYTYGFEYTYGSDGPQISTSYTTTVNPGEQCKTTFKEYNYVRWNCTPYSNGETWVMETSCLTRTASNLTATTRVGFEEFVVDNWLLQYESPCALVMNVSY